MEHNEISSTTQDAPGARRPPRGLRLPAFRRSDGGRVLAGVAAGMARAWDIDVVLLRAAFVALCAAGGAGVLLYLLAWAISGEPLAGDAATAAPRRVLTPVARQRRLAGLGCIVLGLLVVLRDVGLWFGDRVVWPLVLGVLGSAVIWVRSDERDRWMGLGMRGAGGGRTATVRVVVGAVLVAGGMAAVVLGNQVFSAAGGAVLAMAVTAGGLLLILGPWLFRVWREAAEDRRQRIRSEERAEMAAHLHDSVLNTLALIQRSGSAPADVVAMARTQERELRAWLQGRPLPSEEAETLEAAIEGVAARVEAAHQVAVESVVVGDLPLDERVRALVAAVQEAAVNAARHSGETRVSIYVEVDGDGVTAYVRDRGRGFDPAAVPEDRRGIRESIQGRLRRHGGSASISSAPGEGTQVQMHVEREPS